MPDGAIVVLDVGKTMSKLSLWSSTGAFIDRVVRSNERCFDGDFDVLDVDGITAWLLSSLTEFAGRTPIAHIIPVSHGAGLAAIRCDRLIRAPLDYELEIPRAIRDAYSNARDSFAATGSPPLPEGLNAGIQLFLLENRLPGILDEAVVLPWAQYWAWFLSGEARSEITSLGCHTDLWSPAAGGFSGLAKRLGWAQKFAPLAFAGDVVGQIRPELARLTGLPGDTQIHCGLHDSNAALIAARALPQIAGQEATVLSTGTWFVAMRLPAQPFSPESLPPQRDCLVNVDAWGKLVPSARFMGGREIETLIGIDPRRVDIKPDQPALLAAVEQVLASGAMLQPGFAHGFGPFPEGRGRWINMPDDWMARRAAACLYAALVADVCLDLIGAHNFILVEGRFAEAEVITRALARLRPDDRVYTSHAHSDVSFGALRLLIPDLAPNGECKRVVALENRLDAYRREWRRLAAVE